MRILLLFIVLLCTSFAYGQREAANWYFGANAGLTFNTGEPIPLLDGVINTTEGCESISDAEGNLLFYTDGVFVWNRNNELMPNGFDLLGSPSATQSALVVPKPGSPSIYYIFTSDAANFYESGGAGNGFNYSIVDMNAASGLGDVTSKNNNLITNSSEKITSVLAADGENFWVITHFQNKFYSYLITNTGVNVTPVISTIGPNIDDFSNIRGAIKASPDGNKLAVAHTLFEPSLDGLLFLYDLNNETGVISNQLELGNDLVFYGVEFSSDSSKIFASGKDVVDGLSNNIIIIQFDLDAPDVTTSRFLISSVSNFFLSDLAGSLQIAIDGKIYHSIPNSSLSVIKTPDLYGLDSDYRPLDTDLGGRNTRFGLPPFIQSFFESIVKIENFCLGDDTQFTLITDDVVTAISWDFGDLASGVNNTSTLFNPSHQFSTTGIFTVTFDVEFESRAPKSFLEFVEISDRPIVNQNITLVQCDIDGVNDGITLFNLFEVIPDLIPDADGFTANFFETLEDATNNENNLEQIGYQNLFNGQPLFVRVFANALCFEIVEITLVVEPMANAGDITLSVCNRSENPDFQIVVDLIDLEEILLETYPDTQISFFLTEDDALFELNVLIDIYEIGIFVAPELYFRIENNNECVSIGHILIDARNSPIVEDQTILVCPTEISVTLDAGDFLEYSWSTGETSRSIVIEEIGEYEVSVFNGTGCDATFSFFVERVVSLDSVEIIVNDFNNNNTITILVNDDTQEYQYSINGGITLQDENVFSNLDAGFHTVQVWVEDCLVYEFEVFIGGAPNYFTPNSDGYHDRWHFFNHLDFRNSTVFIFDRFGKMLKTLNFDSAGWDGTYNGSPMPSSDYWYRIQLEDGRMVSGHFSLIR